MVEIDQRRSNAILRIGRLGLYADTTGTVTITVYDLEDGTVAATHDIDVTAGESLTDDVRIALPAYRKAKRYFITHDLTDFYRVDLFPGCGSCGLRGYTHGGCRIIGGRIDTGVPMRYSNVRSVSHTSGLMAVITVECDHAQMLCEIKDRIALPYSLKVAEEVLRRGIAASERLNAQRLDMDNLKERADRLGAEYVSAMQNSIGNMRMPDDPFCFVCKSPVKSTVILP